jgi:hypothetical protein
MVAINELIGAVDAALTGCGTTTQATEVRQSMRHPGLKFAEQR